VTDPSVPAAAPGPAGAAPDVARPPLSRRERLTLRLEREADLRLGPLGVWVFRRTKGRVARLWKVDALVLTTRGRRTGRERTLVLRYFPDGDAMIVAAANDGGQRHPAWYHNLCADPNARVEVDGRTIAAHAEELPPDEARAAWRWIVEVQPSYERFRRATDRTIPILRLVPDPGRSPDATQATG
jgi:deazaflavin-dependent oxidoreductase (nitroreductase family)